MRSVKQESPATTPGQQGAPPQMNFFNPAAQQPPQTQMPPPNVAPSMAPNMGMPPPQNYVPPAAAQTAIKKPEPAAQVIKGPVPAEHMIIQQTFDAMIDRCRGASANPQVKRKLEDVKRKLEILYDLLRGMKISPNVLNGLHQMIEACKSLDYKSGIQVHTRMISTGNFSEISSFMPGLKTLMQVSNQLKV